jgi:hypothetical protein
MGFSPKIISDKFADEEKKLFCRNYCQFIYGFNFIGNKIQSFSVLLAIVLFYKQLP